MPKLRLTGESVGRAVGRRYIASVGDQVARSVNDLPMGVWRAVWAGVQRRRQEGLRLAFDDSLEDFFDAEFSVDR